MFLQAKWGTDIGKEVQLTRVNFTSKPIATSRVKHNKSLRLKVHHAKTFDDICNENCGTSIRM
jgi:hypothetical protein